MVTGYRPRARPRQRAPALPYAKGVLHRIEEDRRRLAREIHDETGQILTASLFNIDAYLAEVSSESTNLASGIQAIRRDLLSAVRNLRGLVYRLHPPMLADAGLAPTIHWLVRQFATQYGIAADFSRDSDSRLAPPLEMAIYRIVQESLTNVAKHSHAQAVQVRLQLAGEHVVVEVEDDGQGFDTRGLHGRENPTLGLMGMRERAREFGGDVAIFSAPGQGSLVRATLRRASFHATHSRSISRRSRHSSARSPRAARQRE